jgi:hypothetical protein
MEKKLAQSGGASRKTAKGEPMLEAVPQPTLPDISLDDDDLSVKRKKTSRFGRDRDRSKGDYADYGLGYPPNLEYNAPYGTGGIAYSERCVPFLARVMNWR